MIKPLFLLDSNICIYLLEGRASSARDKVEACQPGEVVTSTIAYAEVMRGAERHGPAGQADAEALFRVVVVLPFDEEAARAHVRLPFRRGTFDRLIAAHALALGSTLITNNPRDFADIPDLRIENWIAH